MRSLFKYKHSIVTLIDILGFTERVDSVSNPGQIHSILKQLKHFSDPTALGQPAYEQYFTNFSDTVVKSTPLKSGSNLEYQVGILFHELWDLAFIQANLINMGVLVRGGILIGDIYQDSSYVFGPALNVASQLEKVIAIYPRIVIDPSVLTLAETNPLLKATHHDFSTERTYIKPLIIQADDGMWFINYLAFICSESEDPSVCRQYLEKHKTVILDHGGNENALNIRSVKFTWLANYHNQTITSLPDDAFEAMGISRNSLIISKKDLRDIYYQF